jgi:hypothetical protein
VASGDGAGRTRRDSPSDNEGVSSLKHELSDMTSNRPESDLSCQRQC